MVWNTKKTNPWACWHLHEKIWALRSHTLKTTHYVNHKSLLRGSLIPWSSFSARCFLFENDLIWSDLVSFSFPTVYPETNSKTDFEIFKSWSPLISAVFFDPLKQDPFWRNWCTNLQRMENTRVFVTIHHFCTPHTAGCECMSMTSPRWNEACQVMWKCPLMMSCVSKALQPCLLAAHFLGRATGRNVLTLLLSPLTHWLGQCLYLS